jgi:hypothetical protein
MKNEIFKLIFILLMVSSCHSDCEKYVCSLDINNNSLSTLSIYFSNSYPDTGLYKNLADLGCSLIKPNSTCECINRISWKDHINELCKGGKLTIFVFSKDTINKYTWDSVEAKYKVLKRYAISIEDFQKRGWKIEYPYDSTRGKLNVWP